jgi:hypothetical protein
VISDGGEHILRDCGRPRAAEAQLNVHHVRARVIEERPAKKQHSLLDWPMEERMHKQL